jgi:hypothetical protein
MFKFWCSICLDDKDLFASEIDADFAYATCPDCGAVLKEGFSRHRGITQEEMTIESYNNLHGLDSNTP